MTRNRSSRLGQGSVSLHDEKLRPTERSVYLHNEKLRSKQPTNIHIEKIDQIADELIKLGLAEQSNYPWYRVDAMVANEFMAYLAMTLGRLEEIDAAPVTDQSYSLQLVRGNQSKSSSQRRKLIREVVLGGILPSPSEPVEVKDLIKFKEKYQCLLQEFRRSVESLCIELSSIEDPEMLEDQIQYKVDELTDAIDEIKNTMRSRWHRVSMGTLVPLIGAGASLLATPINPPLAFAGASLSLANAAYQAFGNERQDREIWRHPLAYAALAQTHLR